MINLTSSKLRGSTLQKTLLRKWKDKPSGENIWESHIWWRAVPRLCKEFSNSQNKKISNPILKKMGRFE